MARLGRHLQANLSRTASATATATAVCSWISALPTDRDTQQRGIAYATPTTVLVIEIGGNDYMVQTTLLCCDVRSVCTAALPATKGSTEDELVALRGIDRLNKARRQVLVQQRFFIEPPRRCVFQDYRFLRPPLVRLLQLLYLPWLNYACKRTVMRVLLGSPGIRNTPDASVMLLSTRAPKHQTPDMATASGRGLVPLRIR